MFRMDVSHVSRKGNEPVFGSFGFFSRLEQAYQQSFQRLSFGIPGMKAKVYSQRAGTGDAMDRRATQRAYSWASSSGCVCATAKFRQRFGIHAEKI